MMDFSIGKTRKQVVRPVGHFAESDSEEEKQEMGERRKETQEALVSVEDLQYCMECHRALADRSHLQRHRAACHRT